jgi:thiamine-monophosphate kinase
VRRLGDVGEHAWIAAFVARLGGSRAHRRVLVGPGDDAAVVRPGPRPLLLTVDALCEGVHFRSGWITPAALGRRAFLVNASDLAAMGGRPTFALLAIEAPPSFPVTSLDALVAGFSAAARRSAAQLVGGNLAAGRRLALTVTLLGEAPGRVVTRAGGRPGDALYVTGALGAAALAVRRLAGGAGGTLPTPPLRVEVGRRLAPLASAMIDVSDGLVQDLGHLCRASGVAAELELARIPVAAACRRALGAAAGAFAATGGEDYELLFAVPPRREPGLARLAPRLGCWVTRVGRLGRGRPAVRVLDAAGRPARLRAGGFDHFRASRR